MILEVVWGWSDVDEVGGREKGKEGCRQYKDQSL